MARVQFLICFFIVFISFSQDYNNALKCFLAEDYICAKNKFNHILNNSESVSSKVIEYSQYYHFLSSLKLYNQDTESLFNFFITHFPFSEKQDDAIFFMSEYLFEKKKYKEVVELLSSLNLYKLDISQRNFAFFYLGYSCYKINKYELAKNSFYELSSVVDHVYRDDAIFYNSYILLLEDHKEEALLGFQSLINSKKYTKQVPYFISKILFDLNKYHDVSNYLTPILDSSRCDNYKDLVLLQAKSLYQLSEYDPAIVYFEEYKTLHDTLTRAQLYQIGFSYYKKGLHGFAINHFNKIVLELEDSLAQYAFYYLGDSYRKVENRIEAMNAFRSASLLDLDSLIQHDSFYQFSILCYEQQHPLYDPIQYLSEFIDKYPTSEHIDEVYRCLANTHLNTHNYSEAVSVLEESGLLNMDVKKQYQKISFHKAVQLYNDEFYNEAIVYFDKSISVGGSDSILYKSYYWRGESYYHLKNYDAALNSHSKLYKKNNQLYSRSLYSQAYSHLNLKDYKRSVNKFQSALDYHKEHKFLYDIFMRMGDNYFILMDYQLAIHFYEKALALTGFEDDYASYKKSTSYVLLGDYNNAIKSFNYLINTFIKSNYIDDATYDLGNTYILAQDLDAALKTFMDLATNFKNSLFYAEAKLKLGLVYYMQKNDIAAIDILKNVINEFPNTNTSQEALHVVKNIYSEIGQANQFLELIENVEHDYTKADLDSSMYYSAELQYMQGNYKNAITSLNSYLSYYPQGLFYLETNYYLYKSYETLGDLESAITALSIIVNKQQNKYTTEGLLNLARMSFDLEKYISAEMYFSQLLEIASEIDLKKEAILGLLESKFTLNKYNDIVLSIAHLVKDDLFSGLDEVRICYLKAYSLYKMNKTSKSLIEFNWLINHTEGALKAEAFYYTSLLFYNDEKYDNSQDVIFQLINELPSYQIWIQKALLVLAKTYIMQEDLFQAQHVLIELQKKSNDPEILKELREILNNNFPHHEGDSLINKND